MANKLSFTYTTALILHAIAAGHSYGFELMETTGLPSGTVYPILRRLEKAKLIQAEWEPDAVAAREQRPARRYYRTTAAGEEAVAQTARKYPLLAQLTKA